MRRDGNQTATGRIINELSIAFRIHFQRKQCVFIHKDLLRYQNKALFDKINRLYENGIPLSVSLRKYFFFIYSQINPLCEFLKLQLLESSNRTTLFV